MITARKGWAIIKYEKQDIHIEVSGILIPSSRTQMLSKKGKSRTISTDPDANIPDVIRAGTIVSANELENGTEVLFNRHDGFGFEFDKQYLYSIKEELIMAVINT